MDKKKTMIYVVRHGETDWNLKEKMMGVTDIPLNGLGEKQAEAIAQDLKEIPINIIYSSPLSRTIRTATIINKHHNLPIITTADLREREFGELEGKHYKEIQSIHAAFMFSETWNYPDYRPLGGESANEVNTRVRGFIKNILQKDKGKSILLVSHGVTIRMLLAALLESPPKYLNEIRFKNASLAVVEVRFGKAPTLHIANYVSNYSV